MSSLYVLVVIGALTGTTLSLAPVEEGLDWESFEAALKDDGEDRAISLLQKGASVSKSTVASKNKKTPKSSLNIAKLSEEPAETMGDIPLDAFAETIQSEGVTPEAVSLIQTDAHFERKVLNGRMAVATEADGTHVLMQNGKVQPHDGIMHMSIGADGRLQLEDDAAEVSFIQKEVSQMSAQVSERNMKLTAEGQSPNEMTNGFSDAVQEKTATEALSMLQSGAHASTAADAVATGADADAGKRTDDGMLDISLVDDGKLQEDGAGISLVQRKAKLKVASRPSKESSKLNVKRLDPPGAMDGISPDEFAQGLSSEEAAPQGLSLVQTEAHIERQAMVTGVDGSHAAGKRRLKTADDGVMHISISASGHFRHVV